MNQRITTGIVLTRVDYGEADRIVTILTPDVGKLRLLARGVRKIKSRVAGGIELFSVSEINFLQGKGEIGTLLSARLIKHYDKIVSHIDRVQFGYQLIRSLHKVTEEQPEEAYFDLLKDCFAALDMESIPIQIIDTWFLAQLLKIGGHMPNLVTDTNNNRLNSDLKYNFDFDSVAFYQSDSGSYASDHIKLLRLLFSSNKPQAISRIDDITNLLATTAPIISVLRNTYIKK